MLKWLKQHWLKMLVAIAPSLLIGFIIGFFRGVEVNSWILRLFPNDVNVFDVLVGIATVSIAWIAIRQTKKADDVNKRQFEFQRDLELKRDLGSYAIIDIENVCASKPLLAYTKYDIAGHINLYHKFVLEEKPNIEKCKNLFVFHAIFSVTSLRGELIKKIAIKNISVSFYKHYEEILTSAHFVKIDEMSNVIEIKDKITNLQSDLVVQFALYSPHNSFDDFSDMQFRIEFKCTNILGVNIDFQQRINLKLDENETNPDTSFKMKGKSLALAHEAPYFNMPMEDENGN